MLRIKSGVWPSKVLFILNLTRAWSWLSRKMKQLDLACIWLKERLVITKDSAGTLFCLYLKRSKVNTREREKKRAPWLIWHLVTTTVKQSFKTAAYPSGWFFIRSHVKGSTTESPYVLTATEKSIELTLLDRENWQSQLWSYSNGQLINYATDLMIDVNCKSFLSTLFFSSNFSKLNFYV